MGLDAPASFADISSDPEIQARLAATYDTVDDIDLWVGGLAEDPLPHGHLGPLCARLVIEQFQALRDGDRFWYDRLFGRVERRTLKRTRLSDIIRRNTSDRRRDP